LAGAPPLALRDHADDGNALRLRHPGRAAVRGVEDGPPLAHDPAVLVVAERDVPEGRMLAGPERQGDAGPGPAAIVRSLQQAAMAREPAMRRVQEVDRVGGQVAVLRRAVGQRAPGLAAVLGPDDGRAGGPAVARVDELESGESA